MATGILGTASLSATTNTTIYTVPAGKVSSMSVNFCNRNSSPAAIRLSVSASSTPTADEYFVYDYSVPANGAFERTGLVVNAGKLIVAYSANANVSCQVYGYEE